MSHARRQAADWSPAPFECEADVVEGLEQIAATEIEELCGDAVRWRPAGNPGTLRFAFTGELDTLLDLRTVVAVYLLRRFAIPRPKALLGNQQLGELLDLIAQARQLWTPRSFATLRLSAAGEDSAVMVRLKQELATRTGLELADAGDLLLRLRPADDGWDALVRISPRPLATRAWRVRNVPGALNATVASAMAHLTTPRATDRVLNVACGSGTLLIERMLLGVPALGLACDTDAAMLAAARENLEAAGFKAARLEQWDATRLPLPDASVDMVCADLPFGQLVGTHRDNQELYPRLVAEAGRVCASGGRMALITHEIRLLDAALAEHATIWQPLDMLRVRVGGMTPAIYLLRRRDRSA